jgi:O-antigen/teichoic acid export membrane protein
VNRASVRAELRPMIGVTASEAGARLLSFCFYLLAAREFTTHGFGVVRYTITLSLLAFGATQVLVNAMTREVGAARGDGRRTAEVLGSSLAIGAVVLPGSVALCLAAAAAGLTDGADTAGLVAALIGLAGLQLYYGAARGLGDIARAASTYAGGSLIQLAVFGVIAALSQATPRTALLIYGLSSLVPLLLWELRRPVLWKTTLAVSRTTARRVLTLARPLLVAELCYLIWLSADLVWVQHALGTTQVGLYGAAKTLIQILFVIPAGVTAVLMPRVAELQTGGDTVRARRLVFAMTGGVLAASALVGIVVIALRSPLLGVLYGDAYRASASSLVILTVGAVANAGFVVLTTSAVGWGRPGVYTAGMALAAACELALLAVLPGDHITTAAWAVSGSIALAFVAVGAYLFAVGRRRTGPPAPRPSAGNEPPE